MKGQRLLTGGVRYNNLAQPIGFRDGWREATCAPELVPTGTIAFMDAHEADHL